MKKTISILLSVIMLISVIASSAISVSAEINLNNYKNYYIGQNISSSITENNDCDVYKFSLSKSGAFKLDFTGYLERICIHIYDINGEELYRTNPYWNSNLKVIRINETKYFNKGTYYLCIEDFYYTGDYSFKTSFKSSEETFTETINKNNNSFSSVNNIKFGTSYKGVIVSSHEVDNDNYKFTMPLKGTIKLSFTGYLERICIHIYDINGEELYRTNPYWNDKTKQIIINDTVSLNKGTYYLCIEDNYYTGNYNFKLSYTVSKPGTPSVSISKGKSTFRWAKAAGVSGYQLEISRYSNFKKISVKKTQSSNKYTKTLSRKTKYYVRVRSYKKIGSKTYYSSWATKSFKTK